MTRDGEPRRVDADVAIIGYGPVGACIAALLGARGWTAVVLEREAGVYHQPRAAHFDAEVMRVFQAIGIADALAPAIQPVLGMHFVRSDGTKIFGFDAPSHEPQGWPTGFMFTQPELETVLRQRVAALPSVDVRLRHEVVAIEGGGEADGEGGDVVIHAVDLQGGCAVDVHCAYAIGCDGGRSLTRKAVGTELDDLGLHQPWLVVDTRLTRDVALPEVNLQICEPQRPTTYIRMPREWRRWEFMLMPGDVAEDMATPERAWELVAPWVGPDDAQLVRHVVYTFHALCATRWRRGRVLLAGDAAHQMPPFLGQGMCAGIRDAANLTWKLDLVLRGLALDGLLDTYQSERSAHVRSIIDMAVTLGSIIQTTDPELAASRDRELAANPPPAEPEAPVIGAGVLPAAGGADPDEAVGRPAPQPVSPSGERWDDVVGLRFALIGDLGLAAPDMELWTSLGAHLAPDPPPTLAAWLADHGATGAIVRPDRITLGFTRGPGDGTRLTDAVRVALAPAP